MAAVEYQPSSSLREYVRFEEGMRFMARYVHELGRPRKKIRVSGGEAILQLDSAGALASVPILVELAAGSLSDMEWEEVEYQPPSGWLGDLEPTSPAFRMEVDGPKANLPDGFRYSPPSWRDSLSVPLELGARLALRLEGDGVDITCVLLLANGAGFLSIAKRIVYLAQPSVPMAARVVFERDHVEATDLRLVIERAEFPKNARWATSPATRR